MNENKAKEKQNQVQFDNYKSKPAVLGPYTTHIWNHDPRHLGFLLSRYKFVAKMLEGHESVVEIGVGDGFGVPVVAQTVGHIHGVDWEPLLIEDNLERYADLAFSMECLDITKEHPNAVFTAAYSLDVIEHIPTEREHLYFENICKCLHEDGVFIMGTPNITANQYASAGSKEGHVNLLSHSRMRELLSKYFKNVFMFSMNDEVIHTGYGPMSHYLMGVGVGLINP
ncbi:MAG: methyltransferase domain-containing protein [Candidatus Marinimicrobia bacterium]|nr:methyltransferase domain-containing protein [Candidatus Neomarinimicrobiota bacterium]